MKNEPTTTKKNQTVSVDDGVFATGRLVSDGGITRLDAVAYGLYDQVIRGAGGISVATDLPSDSAMEGVVTVQGFWAGESIRNARVVDLVAPISMPDRLGDGIDPDIVPAGRLARNEVLASTVLGITQELSDDSLLFYCAYNMTDGWIGIACATDSAPVEHALKPILGHALAVVEVDWTPHDLRLIDEFFEEYDFADGLLSFGKFMHPAGQFSAYALVRIITPEMTSSLSTVNPNAIKLTSWIQKS
ncbi:hypothetical protein [Cryobacterium sp. PH31-O1]|uniref:hypothetical protein n=1 Tax=Cryobacterium sp. PH31-O1 TaxID=3046306 RepID=UPI0024BA7989|nr:hypothetical protein [Cryobacterium sp. PH31-O1]MDJ0339214.1 hypothetical protein [Cryobacterium sp. PH31-O1]